MRPSPSQDLAEQRRREIELAFAFLFGPAVLGQRIALEALTATLARAGPAPSGPHPADQPGWAAPTAAPAPAQRRPTLKRSYVGFERSGAPASPP